MWMIKKVDLTGTMFYELKKYVFYICCERINLLEQKRSCWRVMEVCYIPQRSILESSSSWKVFWVVEALRIKEDLQLGDPCGNESQDNEGWVLGQSKTVVSLNHPTVMTL
jgi:hypothetical protein